MTLEEKLQQLAQFDKEDDELIAKLEQEEDDSIRTLSISNKICGIQSHKRTREQIQMAGLLDRANFISRTYVIFDNSIHYFLGLQKVKVVFDNGCEKFYSVGSFKKFAESFLKIEI